jgi:hypothetical protein
MSSTTHTEPEELVSDHVEVAEDALSDATGAVISDVSSKPSKLEEDETGEVDGATKN